MEAGVSEHFLTIWYSLVLTLALNFTMIRSRKRPVKTELELEDEAPPVLEPEPNAEVEFQDYVSILG